MKRHRSVAISMVIAAAGAGLLVAAPASAAQIKTHIIVDLNGSPVSSISMTVGGADVTLTTHMDGKCLSAFAHANDKTFGIAPSVDAPSVATLAPSLGYPGLTCESTSQSWNVHAVGNGDTTLRFAPVANNNGTDNGTGLQKQMAGASVQVHVGTGGVDNPPGHGLPAAPAVTNSHVPKGSALADACKAHYSDAKNWHGLLIKEIAKWARDNHYNRLKHTYSEAAWMTLVTTKVDSVCNSAPTT
jgi:hypothetical protein